MVIGIVKIGLSLTLMMNLGKIMWLCNYLRKECFKWKE